MLLHSPGTNDTGGEKFRLLARCAEQGVWTDVEREHRWAFTEGKHRMRLRKDTAHEPKRNQSNRGGKPTRDAEPTSVRDGGQPYTSEIEDYEGGHIEKPNKAEVDEYRETKK